MKSGINKIYKLLEHMHSETQNIQQPIS